MPTITIDGQRVEVPPGATILDAARRLGIDIPTLCHRDGFAPSTSCLVCVVKVRGLARLVPSCATLAVDGMAIESETPEVHDARRTALELLLGDHLGDCLAPCQWSCPVHLDVPRMLREIRDGQFQAAIATIRRDMALPAVLGRVCGRPCEKACRRAAADEAVAVCSLKAQMAQRDLASDEPYVPPRAADSGRRVAIIGAGPCGLAAAYHLALAGHRVVLYERQSRAGGRLRHEFDPATLPPDLLDAEIAQIVRLGVELRLETAIGDKASFDQLCRSHDAVLVASGAEGRRLAADWGLAVADRGIEVEKGSYRTNLDGVFAAGGAIRAKGPVVRSVADGKEAAATIDALLGGSSAEAPSLFTVRSGRLAPEEIAVLVQLAGTPPEPVAADDPSSPLAQAQHQAARCLHCDCRGRDACRLRIYAERYNARPTRYQGTRRRPVILRTASGVIFDSGKCIDCGLCIQVVSRRRGLLGLTFIGRGFNVRIGVPLDRSLDEALGNLAAECAAVCPTAALSKTEPRP